MLTNQDLIQIQKVIHVEVESVEKRLSQRIGAIEKQLSQRIDRLSQRIDRLSQRIDAVERRLSKKIDKVYLEAIALVEKHKADKTKVGQLEQRVERIERDLELPPLPA